MSTAAERAEARRKAILAKRGDRLAKLTTTARGDEGTYLSDEVSSFSKSFLGEESSTDMPTPPRFSVSPSPGPTPSKATRVSSPPTAPSPASSLKPETLFSDVDDSVWSSELQEQFRHALLNANPMRSHPSSRVPSATSNQGHSPGPQAGSNPGSGPGEVDPLAEIMASLGGGIPGQSPGSDMFNLLQQMRQGAQPPTPESDTSKRDKAIRRIIQLISAWLLLVYFVFFLEPSAYRGRVGSLDVGRWSRWAVLGGNELNMFELLSTFKVQPQPAFFWAFAALEAALHFNAVRNLLSSRSEKSHLDTFGPVSKILSLINIIMLILNDLGTVVFGIGVVVLLAGYASPK